MKFPLQPFFTGPAMHIMVETAIEEGNARYREESRKWLTSPKEKQVVAVR